MKKLVAVAAAVIGISAVTMAPAGAAGQLCYDVNISISGQEPIAQAGCHDLP